MIWTENTIMAMKLAYKSHQGREDKLGVPHIYHLMEVAEQLDEEDDVIVGLLHDYVEDACVGQSKKRIRGRLESMGFNPDVIDAIFVITHDPKIPYENYIRNVVYNDIAYRVKLADLASNSNPHRLIMLSEKDRKRLTSKCKNTKTALANARQSIGKAV